MDPKLTVITPVYNGEQYIEACIRNVLSQKCPEVEHLIIDGNSTDNTKKIVGELAMKNPNIMFITGEDSGQSDAMNKGVELTQAPAIGFLNVDDFYEPDVLKRVVRKLKKVEAPALLFGNCNILDANDNTTSVNKPQRIKLTDILAGREFPYNPSCYFYHKSLHDIVGKYDETEHYAMDLDFLLRAVQKASLHYFDETWGNFRFIEGTKTHSQSEAGTLIKRCDQIKQKYFEQTNIFQRLVIQAKETIDKLERKLKCKQASKETDS